MLVMLCGADDLDDEDQDEDAVDESDSWGSGDEDGDDSDTPGVKRPIARRQQPQGKQVLAFGSGPLLQTGGLFGARMGGAFGGVQLQGLQGLLGAGPGMMMGMGGGLGLMQGMQLTQQAGRQQGPSELCRWGCSNDLFVLAKGGRTKHETKCPKHPLFIGKGKGNPQWPLPKYEDIERDVQLQLQLQQLQLQQLAALNGGAAGVMTGPGRLGGGAQATVAAAAGQQQLQQQRAPDGLQQQVAGGQGGEPDARPGEGGAMGAEGMQQPTVSGGTVGAANGLQAMLGGAQAAAHSMFGFNPQPFLAAPHNDTAHTAAGRQHASGGAYGVALARAAGGGGPKPRSRRGEFDTSEFEFDVYLADESSSAASKQQQAAPPRRETFRYRGDQ